METKIINKKTYEIIEHKYHLNNVSSYIVKHNNKLFENRVFTSGFDTFLSNMKASKKCGIPVLKIIKIDKKNNQVLLSYYPIDTVLTELIGKDLDEIYFKEIFKIYRFCRFSSININYFSNNFILTPKGLIYTCDEIYKYSEEHNFINEGINYWFYSEEIITYLKKLSLPIDNNRIIEERELKKKMILVSLNNW